MFRRRLIMREILFRGKIMNSYCKPELNGQWAEGEFFADRFGYYINVLEGEYEADSFCISPETFGQYTGLKDRNGKRIFEGDVVLRCYTGSTGKENRVKQLVVFEKGCFLTKRIDDDYFHGVDPNGYNFYEDYQTLETSTKECPRVNGSFEVIGNIHDNPELLEGGAK
jgi:uncharacterized phage protein (TIGR01671 family)